MTKETGEMTTDKREIKFRIDTTKRIFEGARREQHQHLLVWIGWWRREHEGETNGTCRITGQPMLQDPKEWTDLYYGSPNHCHVKSYTAKLEKFEKMAGGNEDSEWSVQEIATWTRRMIELLGEWHEMADQLKAAKAAAPARRRATGGGGLAKMSERQVHVRETKGGTYIYTLDGEVIRRSKTTVYGAVVLLDGEATSFHRNDELAQKAASARRAWPSRAGAHCEIARVAGHEHFRQSEEEARARRRQVHADRMAKAAGSLS